MKFEELILTISSKLDNVPGYKKSIVEADLDTLSDYIEEAVFKLRIAENNYKKQEFLQLKEQNIQTLEAIGLLFLSYLTCSLRTKFTYGVMWPIVLEELLKYENITKFFYNKYFLNQHPNPFLVTCIGSACERFNLRNSFDHQVDEHYIRNTILLQMGILNRFSNLNTWLSYSSFNQTTLRTLLNKENINFSRTFSQGWRVLRRYRDHVIDNATAISLLKQNVWFKDLDIENALRAARKKIGKKFLAEDEIENVFFLDQILYEDNLLKFVLNAEDLYALKLSGSDYSVYIDDKYVAKVLRNDDKVLVLDKKIIIKEPDDFSLHLELKNEDNDIVYRDEIMLFDLHDQVLIFDDKGNIYKDFSKKLAGNRAYGMLFDSDLDCKNRNQIEYFSGYVSLVSGISKDNNCILSYDGEELFSLNFTASVEKPEWIDHLVVFAANSKLSIEEPTDFHLKIFDIEDEENPLKELPNEAKIIRWTYARSYVDEEEIKNFTASIELSPDLICEKKHSFLIRYKGQMYHRTIDSVIYDHTNKYHLIQRLKNGDIHLIEHKPILNYDEILQSRFYLALFNFDKSKEPRILKDKMKFYGKIGLNKKFQLTISPKFGETIIVSEHLYNDVGDVLFKVVQQGIVKNYDISKKTVELREVPIYLNECEFVVLDNNYKVYSLKQSNLIFKNNKIELVDEYLSLSIIYDGNYIGSFVHYDKINFAILPNDVEVLKVLYMSYIPLLLMDKGLLHDWIKNHLITFFKAFTSDSFVTPNGQIVYFNFEEVNATIEHLLYDVELYKDEAHELLQDIMLNGWTDKAIKMPILLIYLLQLVGDKKLTAYFLSLISEVEIPEDRDELFIDTIIENSLQHFDLNNIEKHNLKIAMHHKYKTFFLNESLNKLQESYT